MLSRKKISYREHKTERESMPIGITYADEKMSGWYDTYVNAVWKMGLIEGSVTIAPKEALTYGTCKALIDQIIIKNPNFQAVYTGLSFDFMKAEEEMLISEFLEMYEAILAIIPEEEQVLKQETLLVLGREVTEDGKDRMVTDHGKYYYQNAKSYEEQVAEEITIEVGDHKSLVDQYMDKGIKALVSNQELIYITSVTMDKIVVPNVWIENGENLQVDAFINGIHKSFSAEFKLSNPIKKVIGDITVENQKVVRISVKPDMIQGKVLRSGDDFIEIEGYGKVPLEKDYKIYKIYGELSIEPTGSILVGYENTDFIVSSGKISAALITESIKAENIRVLIQTTGFKDILHEKVEFTATTDFTVSSKEKDYTYLAGETVAIKQGNELLADGRITIKPLSDNGKIEIRSIDRTNGNPKYRGIIEIAEGDNGLLIVNELPLEEYLYAVIPSEMPTSYGNEALKVQAVCARSYAYKHLLANSLSQYGAHVDDSVSYQVYNNIAENEDSILAVKDTYGQVIEYEGDVITAYYFSTSCGHTTEAASVWANDIKMPYLSGKLILIEEEGEKTEAQNELADQYQDLSSEENFRSFIDAKEIPTYDSTFNWYRWKVTMGIKEIKKVIDNNIAKRQTASEYLKKLEQNKILSSVKIGNEIYYINNKLIDILSK